jgi:tetratricopeptide (TPR) repeat protein
MVGQSSLGIVPMPEQPDLHAGTADTNRTSAHTPAPDSAPVAAPATSFEARYQLLEEIAHGGMGVVWRAADDVLGREVAVKFLHDRLAPDSASARRFADEARIAAQLQHPAIPPVHDMGTLPDGRPFLAMKFIKGSTLDVLLAARPEPGHDRGRFVAVFEQVCQALAYAHSHGVIHRDLKPGNVMVGAFGEVQVMDWGLAKVLARRERQRPEADPLLTTAGTEVRSLRDGDGLFTQAGSVLGTPAFMPPEQAAGALTKVDARSDVFGLGAILAVILTGQPPFVAASAETTRLRSAQGKVQDCFARLDGCGADPDLVALCKRCLAPDAVDRPSDAAEVAAAVAGLRQAAEERARRAELDRVRAEAERVAAELREAEQRKRRRVQRALALAVGLLLLGGLTFGWWQAEQGREARERLARNAEAVAGLLDQCQQALRSGDAARAVVTLEAAQKRSAEGGADEQAELLARCADDLIVLRDLDIVDRFRWTLAENRFPDIGAVAVRYGEALGHFGAYPDTAGAEQTAARLSGSAVRDRLVAALDRLLLAQKSAAVRATLKAIDPDPFRDAVRDAVRANDLAAVAKLAGRAEALEQPPGFAAFLGESETVGLERRRELLATAVQRRPGDLGLLMALAATYTPNRREWAEERARWYQAAVAVAPANSAAHNNLGHALKDKGDVEGSIAACKEAIRLDPRFANAHHNLGFALSEKKDLEGAIAEYKQAIRLDPMLAMAHNNLGWALYEKKDLEGAIAEYRQAIRLDVKLALAHNNLGVALKDKGDVEGAIAAYREAIRLDPKFTWPHSNLGTALKDKGDVEGAIAAYREAIRLDPKFARALDGLGLALFDKKDLDGASAAFREAIRLDPRDAKAHTNLGIALFDRKDVKGAIAAYREAIRLDPRLAPPHYNLGTALKARGDLEGAIAAYREAIRLLAGDKRAIRLNPKYALAHNDLGTALYARKDLEGAIAAYREAIRLDPKLAPAHSNLGAALKAWGDLEGALAEFRQAIRLDPRYAMAHYNLGVTLSAQGKMEEAVAEYREAIRLDPKYAMAHSDLGNALAAKGDLEGAVAAHRQAIRLDPRYAPSHNNLGNALKAKGDLEGAVAAYREAIRLDPKFAGAQINLGIALATRGDLEGAVAAHRQAIRLAPKFAMAHYNLGVTLGVQGKKEEAIACYKKVIELDPRYAEAHCNLGHALQGQGQFAAALVALKRGNELGSKRPGWRYPSAAWVSQCQRLVDLDGRLDAVLSGTARPDGPAQVLEFARLCVLKKRYAASVRFSAEGFALEPKRADDLGQAHRYSAACCAALAAAGQGLDATDLRPMQRLALRRQALTWLRDDLRLRHKQLTSGAQREAAAARAVLLHWQKDSDLAGLRDADALDKLSAQERQACASLWADVTALLHKVRGK